MTENTTWDISNAAQKKPNWLGVPGIGAEHRTVGPHRAWCYADGEWCYPLSLCWCCDQTRVPNQWRGEHPGELLAALRTGMASIPHAPGCPGDEGCWCPVKKVLELIGGETDGSA